MKKIYDAYQKGENYKLLLSGKVTQDYAPTIEKLLQLGLAVPNTHDSFSFGENKNTHKKLDFILENLK